MYIFVLYLLIMTLFLRVKSVSGLIDFMSSFLGLSLY